MNLVNLPDAVLERLDTDDLTDNRGAEVRPRAVEVRQDGETLTLRGYATVWDQPYDVAGGPALGGFSETIARGAATKSLSERADVRLLVNHEGIPLARTRSGTLRLEADDDGLLVESELDARSPLVQSVRSAMDRGDLDEMSFAFRAIRQEWNDDYTERRITELALFDVSVVTYPANPATVAGLRADETVADTTKTAAMPLGLARAHLDALRLR